jgi:phospho-N-acetylmuramoyl-pentapeptide-transferase
VGLRFRPKLFIALVIGGALGWIIFSSPDSYGTLELPWLRRTVALGWGGIPFAMMVVAGCAHAVNLTDGMDGLAAGCMAIALAALGVWAMQQADPRHRTLVIWAASLAGASLGFLWFNSFPASIFLGDVGALGLGAALGAISLLTHAALWLPVIGGVFVVEAVSVMLQVASYRWRGKRRVFRVAPVHHHFHLGGVSEPKLIVRFWIVGAILAMVGFTAVRP